MSPQIAILGLGEAGSEIAIGLVAAGASVRGYDPKVPSVDGVTPRADDADAVRDADLVLSVNSAADAVEALTNALPALRPGTIWADLNTASPATKTALAQAAGPGVHVVDVALMAPVPGKGLQTPMLASGDAAHRYADLLNDLGATVSVIDGPVGAAISRKLLRSVFYKGVAAAVVEALSAADAAGYANWLATNIRAELASFDTSTIDRLIDGTHKHAKRRADEMAAATDLLTELGVPARIAPAARDLLIDLRDAAPEFGHAAVAEILTDAPARYAKQLVSHLRRTSWHTEGDTSTADLAGGIATVTVGTGVLTLRAKAGDMDTLQRIQQVLGSHLERFGQRNDLTVVWHTA